MALQILHQDAHLLAVHKPGGLPVQADKTGDPFLLERLAEMFPTDSSLGLPHRLDRPVSGAIIVTRTPEALAAMNVLFANRAVMKTYWAIVTGMPPETGTWAHRLEHDAHNHKARVVENTAVEVSHVAFKRLAAGDRYSLLELMPDAGRFHQLRVQCAAAGFPIKGDVKYGARRGEKDRTIGLHARQLMFIHPFTRETVHIEASPPSVPLWDALLNMYRPPIVDAP